MRFRPIGLLLSGVVVASSACSMDATAPSSHAPAALAPSAAAASASEWTGGTDRNGGSGDWNGGGDWNDSRDRSGQGGNGGNAAGSTSYAVTIDPRRLNVLRFGAYTLTVPARAICSEKSGYGLEVFDKDCKNEKNPVTIAAVVRSTDGGVPRIDLMPAMRFNPKLVVTLTLSVADLPAPGSSPRFLYCPTASMAACIDEAELDPTLATQVDTAAKTVFRRIKHFSGYFVEW
jgi:hypothetical protein